MVYADLSDRLRSLPPDAVNVALALEFPLYAGFVADLLLIDASGSQVLQVSPKGYAGHAHANHSFPFRIGGDLETIVTVINPHPTKEMRYAFVLYYEGETYTAMGTRLAPWEVKHISIRSLRDGQIAGQQGKRLPLTLPAGQVKVFFQGPKGDSYSGHSDHSGHGGSEYVGISGASIVDTRAKISLTTCVPAPPVYVESVYADTNDVEGFVGEESDNIDIRAVLSDESEQSVGFDSYSPTNSSVAEVYAYDEFLRVSFLAPGAVQFAVYTPELPASQGNMQFTEYITVTVQACTLTITEDTISPGDGSLPVRNPARIRTGFAPVFEVTRNLSNCPITWSIVSGPGSIIGSTTSTLVTVSGTSAGTVVLRATTAGANYAQISVPVVSQQTVDVRIWIVRENNGANAATTTQRASDDIDDANLIWVQCGIQFNLVSISFIDNTTYLNPTDLEVIALTDLHMNTGGMEIYYVNVFFDHPSWAGGFLDEGIVISDGGNNRTAAHELGHGMGLGHGGTADLHLMHETTSTQKADIKLSECNGLTQFTSI